MASSFFGLYVQRDALQLAQKSLDITGHNITNIKTEGYSRQRLDVCAVANTKGSLNYNTKIGLAGQGADAIGVAQTRDKLLDTKYRKYSSELCDIGSKTSVLSDIEDIVDDVENVETGLTAIFGKWEASFQSFSATGADRKDLANISINSANSVIDVLKNFATRISETEDATMKDLESTATRVNSILSSMAKLNKQIEDAYVQMNDVFVSNTGYQADNMYGPLELKDQFNLLADELSEYLNITVSEEKQGSFTVTFGDQVLVQLDKYAKVDVKMAPDKVDEVTDAAGNVLNVRYFDKDPAYDEEGHLITGTPKAGTKLYTEKGRDSGLYADGAGGFMDEDGNSVEIRHFGESKFYDQDGNEIKNIATVNDGSVVTDDNGNTIKVKGNFDAECIEYTFSELYVSSANTEKGWIRAQRELTSEIESAGFGDMIVDLNSLIETGDIEEAFRLEKQIMDEAAAKGVNYSPIFKEHLPDPDKAPEYALSYTEETGTLESGSLKGLFDMYNGEGFYSGLRGNSYRGVKYYAESYRSMARAIVSNFNGLFDEYNATVDESKGQTKFKMFTFDGPELIGNLRIADEWKDDPLRCVHPQGTKDEDYNYDELDNAGINRILSAFSKKYDFGDEPLDFTFGEFITNIGNTLGSDLEYELSDFESTNIMFNSVGSAREEVMGVSMAEEGVNMMNYQKWYNAISRMITAMDQCLEKLINGTGVVGT